MSTIDRDARVTVQLTWDEAGFLWYDALPVAAVTDPATGADRSRFVFVDERGRASGDAAATIGHPAVRAGSLLHCAGHTQARILARVLTAHGHLAHVLGHTDATSRSTWVVLTSCPVAVVPGSQQVGANARPLRAVS